MSNILFLSENLVKESHTGELLAGLIQTSDRIKAINYYDEYLCLGKKLFEKTIFDLINNDKYDLLILNLGTTCILDPEFIINLSNKFHLKTCVIFGDPEHNFEIHDRYYAQCSDLCWVFSPAVYSLFKMYGYEVFHDFGLSISHRNYRQGLEKKYDVSFVGGINRGDRRNYINFLLKNGVDLFLAGHGSSVGLVSNSIKDEIIQCSKVHINFSKVENKSLNIYSRLTQFKSRIYESFMLNTFCLTEYYYGVEDQLGEDYEKICFSDPENLIVKLDYYLARPDEMTKLTKHFRKIILEKYETRVVANNLLIFQNKLVFKSKEFIPDDLFLTYFIGQRFYFFGWFLCCLNFKAAFEEIASIKNNFRQIKVRHLYYEMVKGGFHA